MIRALSAPTLADGGGAVVPMSPRRPTACSATSGRTPNLRWVADITEFPTGEGKLHLAAIRDLCHRGIVGWTMDEHQDAQLVVDALTMALGRTARPTPTG